MGGKRKREYKNKASKEGKEDPQSSIEQIRGKKRTLWCRLYFCCAFNCEVK